jgi:hypothetical protein
MRTVSVLLFLRQEEAFILPALSFVRFSIGSVCTSRKYEKTATFNFVRNSEALIDNSLKRDKEPGDSELLSVFPCCIMFRPEATKYNCLRNTKSQLKSFIWQRCSDGSEICEEKSSATAQDKAVSELWFFEAKSVIRMQRRYRTQQPQETGRCWPNPRSPQLS